MAHPAQREFCLEVKRRFPDAFRGNRVLEMGARDVNGSLRSEFSECQYTGVDCESGKGVDVVCLGHEFAGDTESYDTVFSTEMFEHDPHAEATLDNMLRMLKPGGLAFGTCAGDGRAEHGTRRTGNNYGPDADFYRNVSTRLFLEWLDRNACRVGELYLRHNRAAGDLYFYLTKAPTS